MTVANPPPTEQGVRRPVVSADLIAHHIQIAKSLRRAAIHEAVKRIQLCLRRWPGWMKQRIAPKPNPESAERSI